MQGQQICQCGPSPGGPGLSRHPPTARRHSNSGRQRTGSKTFRRIRYAYQGRQPVRFHNSAGMPTAGDFPPSTGSHCSTVQGRGDCRGVPQPNQLRPGFLKDRTSQTAARTFQHDLYTTIRNDALLGTITVSYLTGGSRIDLKASPDLADFANAHPYPY